VVQSLIGHSARLCQRGLVDNRDGASATAASRSIPYRFEEAVPGVVCDPVRNDMVTAVRDGGAPLNGRPIAVSANHQLRSSLLAMQVPI
jgi:myo-inositol-1(or 4)-monophosphatase